MAAIVKRTSHECHDGQPRRLQWTDTAPKRCPDCRADVAKLPISYVVYYRAAGRQRGKTFSKWKDADRFAANVSKDLHEGTYLDIRPVPMREVFDSWIEHVIDPELAAEELKPSYVKSSRSRLSVHLRPALDDVRSDQLTDVMPELLRALRKKKLAPKSIKEILGLLSVILAWAREPAQRYLRNDPLAAIHERRRRKRHSAAPAREVRHLEPEELRALLDAAEGDPVASALLWLAAYAGLRRGEMFALQWSDVDEEACQLRVRRSIYQGAITSPKTRSSDRRLDIPRPLLERLQTYRKACPTIAPGFVFRGSEGKPLDADNWFRRVFVPLARRAGLRPAADAAEEAGELIGLHTLRHTYASTLIAAGENLKYVSRQLGHARIHITIDTYGHLLRESSTGAMERLAARMESTASQQKQPEQPESAGIGRTTERP